MSDSEIKLYNEKVDIDIVDNNDNNDNIDDVTEYEFGNKYFYIKNY